MSNSAFTLHRGVCVCVAAFILSSAASAQLGSASCTFKLFGLANNNAGMISVNSANKWGTVVGQVNAPQQMPYEQGFIRYSGGSVRYVAPSSAFRVWLNAINDNGVTIGFYEGASDYFGFMVQQSTLTFIVDPKASPAFGQDTRPNGINKWNSMVGQYLPASGIWTGFKRFSNGSFIDLAYPGSNGTYPNAINDSGLVVGLYYDTNYTAHGFIYHNGNWANLDAPFALGTSLIGVSNSGAMLGASFGSGWFLYVNGAFETLPSVPNSTATTFDGLSPDGFFTGTTTDSAGQQHGFIATCK